jgi:hypothetical protein
MRFLLVDSGDSQMKVLSTDLALQRCSGEPIEQT